METKIKSVEELIEKYPKIFKDYKGNPGRVNWSLPSGWLFLVDKMCSLLQWDTDKNNYPQVECLQMKEKFGGLRFYTNGTNDKQEGVISFAESLSNEMCMVCGSIKNIKSTNGWISRYCEEHFPETSRI